MSSTAARCVFAMRLSGTRIGAVAMRCPCLCCAMSAPHIRLLLCYAMSPSRATRICYAVSGTDARYAAT
eukprot:718677-Rhodomonas_salina.3